MRDQYLLIRQRFAASFSTHREMTVHVVYSEKKSHKSIMIPTTDTAAVAYEALTAVVGLKVQDFFFFVGGGVGEGVVWDKKKKQAFGLPELVSAFVPRSTGVIHPCSPIT